MTLVFMVILDTDLTTQIHIDKANMHFIPSSWNFSKIRDFTTEFKYNNDKNILLNESPSIG